MDKKKKAKKPFNLTGAREDKFCERCGHRSSHRAKFCGGCGRPYPKKK
jgi:predicted amidophosphoribosyltransferase